MLMETIDVTQSLVNLIRKQTGVNKMDDTTYRPAWKLVTEALQNSVIPLKVSEIRNRILVPISAASVQTYVLRLSYLGYVEKHIGKRTKNGEYMSYKLVHELPADVLQYDSFSQLGPYEGAKPITKSPPVTKPPEPVVYETPGIERTEQALANIAGLRALIKLRDEKDEWITELENENTRLTELSRTYGGLEKAVKDVSAQNETLREENESLRKELISAKAELKDLWKLFNDIGGTTNPRRAASINNLLGDNRIINREHPCEPLA